MEDQEHFGAHEHELETARVAWNPCRSLTTSNSDNVGVLQKKLVPLLTELNMHLTQKLEKWKEDPGEGGAAAGLVAGQTAAHTKEVSQQINDNACELQQCLVPWHQPS